MLAQPISAKHLVVDAPPESATYGMSSCCAASQPSFSDGTDPCRRTTEEIDSMWFKQIVREQTGCATYLVGSTRNAECAVFDPLWDVEPFERAAASAGLRIAHVIDSHAHADHVSGARKLARRTGAQLHLPAKMDASYDANRLRDGDRLRFGEVDLEVLEVPGHRPEQINLLVRDLDRGDEPWCVLTADFLMVGDVARPDLAQPGADGAATLFERSIPRLLALPDFVEAYPGHVAGST